MRVLEIGTGTGWNAARLATLGAEVISIEIDAVIAEQARANNDLHVKVGKFGQTITCSSSEGSEAWTRGSRRTAKR